MYKNITDIYSLYWYKNLSNNINWHGISYFLGSNKFVPSPYLANTLV